jgi:hypothetical protein
MSVHSHLDFEALVAVATARPSVFYRRYPNVINVDSCRSDLSIEEIDWHYPWCTNDSLLV